MADRHDNRGSLVHPTTTHRPPPNTTTQPPPHTPQNIRVSCVQLRLGCLAKQQWLSKWRQKLTAEGDRARGDIPPSSASNLCPDRKPSRCPKLSRDEDLPRRRPARVRLSQVRLGVLGGDHGMQFAKLAG